jgi:hypothetical protein
MSPPRNPPPSLGLSLPRDRPQPRNRPPPLELSPPRDRPPPRSPHGNPLPPSRLMLSSRT